MPQTGTVGVDEIYRPLLVARRARHSPELRVDGSPIGPSVEGGHDVQRGAVCAGVGLHGSPPSSVPPSENVTVVTSLVTLPAVSRLSRVEGGVSK